MREYLIRRVLLLVITLIGVTVLVFAILRLVPGGVEAAVLGEQASPEQFAQLHHQLGLDQPIAVQYGTWLSKVVRGDLGESLVSHRSIAGELAARLPITLELAGMSLVFSILLAIPIGLLAAMRQDTIADYTARSLAIALLSFPDFWIATLIISFGSRLFGYAPPLTYVSPMEDLGKNLQILVPPAIILGAAGAGTAMRLTRTQMLDVLRQDYIRTAWAKGLRERTLVLRHALRNAAIPIITIYGLQIPFLFGGTVILEQVFSVPGMGRYLVAAVNSRDFPVIQAVVLGIGAVVVISNLVVDLSYTVLDPRVRYA